VKRDVLVMLTRPPGRVHVAEGLRAARGVAAGFDRHDVTVLFTEDAVHSSRAAADRAALNMSDHIEDLLAAGGRLVADGEALAERDIDRGDVAADITVLDGPQATALVRQTDHTLDF
jgi:tRNA 2-thiouridine synthesizing protein C